MMKRRNIKERREKRPRQDDGPERKGERNNERQKIKRERKKKTEEDLKKCDQQQK